MIRLHRLGHPDEEYFLNPDLILSIEATPDTIVTLTTHTKVLVGESCEDVVAAVRAWRSSVIEAALPRRTRGQVNQLTLVRAAGAQPGGSDHVQEGR